MSVCKKAFALPSFSAYAETRACNYRHATNICRHILQMEDEWLSKLDAKIKQKGAKLSDLEAVLDKFSATQLNEAKDLVELFINRARILASRDEFARLKPVIEKRAEELMHLNPDMSRAGALGSACSEQEFVHVKHITLSMFDK